MHTTLTNNGGKLKTCRKASLLLFLASFLLYSLASPGNLPGDTETRWSVARQIARRNRVFIEDSLQTGNYATGTDGKRYAFYGIGQSICMLPFAWLGLVIEKTSMISPETSDLLAQFLVSTVLFPAIGAMGVWIFYRIVLLLGYSQAVAILTSAVFAFATMNLHYSVCAQEPSQIALLLLVMVLLGLKNQQRPRFVYTWLLCVLAGLCLLFRLTTIVMVLPIYLVGAGTEILAAGRGSKLKATGKWICAGIFGTAWFIVFIVWYNYARFGSCFETGYTLVAERALSGRGLFESRPLPTLAAMLFSPGKSILLYNPVLLFGVLSAYGFYRRCKSVTLAISLAIVGNFVLYSFFTAWSGDYAWSIRYQVSVLPFLALPLAEFFARWLNRTGRIIVISVIAVSCLIQLASVVYNFNLEFVQNPNHSVIADDYVWDWSQSHLRKRFENIGRGILNKRDFSSVAVTDPEPGIRKFNHSPDSVRHVYRVNFFPFKARANLASARLFYILLTTWIAGLVILSATALKLIQLYTRQKSELEEALQR